MAKKSKQKSTAKSAKKKRRPRKATPEKKLTLPGWSEAMKRFDAEAERYWCPRNTQKIVEGRALIDRILAARDNPKPAKAQPAPAPVELLDTRVWFDGALKRQQQRERETVIDYARRLEKLQPANVTKRWTLRTIRRRLHDR